MADSFSVVREELAKLNDDKPFSNNELEIRFRRLLLEADMFLEKFFDEKCSDHERLFSAAKTYRAFEAAQGSFKQWKRSVTWEKTATEGLYYTIERSFDVIRRLLTEGVSELYSLDGKEAVRYLIPASFIPKTSPAIKEMR